VTREYEGVDPVTRDIIRNYLYSAADHHGSNGGKNCKVFGS